MSLEERLRSSHPNQRILTIQSHVVHGYAGNRCSVFPLQVVNLNGAVKIFTQKHFQLHGFEVDVVNSVQFSNHTGYKEGVKGYRLTAKDLALLYEGLKINDLNTYSHVMSGYCGDSSFLREICAIVKDVKRKNPELVYVCDPVLGDNGRYYVPSELCGVYRNELIPLADIITPNAFELSQLSGMKVESEEDCLEAIRRLHQSHPQIRLIVVTSGVLVEGRNDLFYCYASKVDNSGQENGVSPKSDHHAVFRFEIPVIEGQYVGTGDLFTSLLVVWLTQTHNDVPLTICRVISSLQALLRRTRDVAYANLTKADNPSPAQKEIQLVQSRYELLMPKDDIKYVRIAD